MTDPEYRMIAQLKKGECSIERALLIVSGLDEQGVRAYQQKLDCIEDSFRRSYRTSPSPLPEGFAISDDYAVAEALFGYLWGRQKKEILV